MRLHPNPRVDHGWSFQIIFAIWRILLDYYLQNHHFYGCYKPSPNFGRPHPKLPNFCRAARDFQVRTNIDHIWASVDIGPYGPMALTRLESTHTYIYISYYIVVIYKYIYNMKYNNMIIKLCYVMLQYVTLYFEIYYVELYNITVYFIILYNIIWNYNIILWNHI